MRMVAVASVRMNSKILIGGSPYPPKHQAPYFVSDSGRDASDRGECRCPLLLERIGDLEARLGFGSDLVERHIRRELDQRQPAAIAVQCKYAEIGDHHVHDAGAGERQAAAMFEF